MMTPQSAPAAAVKPKACRYQLLIVELLADDETLARVTPADFETDDLVARTWAKTFNTREYDNPVDSWAVVRVHRAESEVIT